MGVTITDTLDGLTTRSLAEGFFEGWPAPPSPETHWQLLKGGVAIALAVENDRIVGFASAVGDGVLSAYIPLLEVVPEFRGRGIGTRLVESLVESLSPCYMIDVECDDDVVPFYERLGFARSNSMIRRDYAAQSGNATL